MKRILSLLCSLVLASAAVFAQTPEEIIARMDEAMEQHDSRSGLAMTMEMKIFILGTFSTDVKTRGDKIRMETNAADKHLITWMDGDTEYDYNVGGKVITIKHRNASSTSKEEENMKMFKSATEGYDVSLTKETDSAWHFRCKKNRSNTNKDDPKTMDLVVAKGTYLPVSLSAKVSGITITMSDLSFDVTEKEVTFDPAAYPGVIIQDQR